jgi:hypothetical protein
MSLARRQLGGRVPTQRKAHRQLRIAAVAAIALTVPRVLAAQPATNGTGASSLTSSAGTSALGAPVIFTATVTGGATSGAVSFYSDGVPIGDAPLALAGGSFKATLTTAALSTGIHVVSASYLGERGVLVEHVRTGRAGRAGAVTVQSQV